MQGGKVMRLSETELENLIYHQLKNFWNVESLNFSEQIHNALLRIQKCSKKHRGGGSFLSIMQHNMLYFFIICLMNYPK